MSKTFMQLYFRYRVQLFLASLIGTLLNTVLIVFGVYAGITQRANHAEELRRVQTEMSAQVIESADIKKKQDSILVKASELRDLIHK